MPLDVSAQSLADVARAAAARRKAQGKTSAKTYTNGDLKKDGRWGAGSLTGRRCIASCGTGGDRLGCDGLDQSGTGRRFHGIEAGETGASFPTPKGREILANRITGSANGVEAQSGVRRRSSEPHQRAVCRVCRDGRSDSACTIEKRRNEAIAEQDRVKADIVQQTKAIAAIEEEARRASGSVWLVALRHPVRPPILIVEDKDSLRTMLKVAIEGRGHEVVEAARRGEAVQEMQQSRQPSSSPISGCRSATALACCAPPKSSIPSCQWWS